MTLSSDQVSSQTDAEDGFLLIDKAEGWTSHDVVDEVRQVLGEQKVGHAGTLDPMATGLVVLGIRRSTRLLRFVQDLPKEYEARVIFGVATDTLDRQGAILSREPMPVTSQEVRDGLGRFVGTITQVPPMVSALRVGGRRMYELAREGREVARAPRQVRVYLFELVDFSPGDYPEATVRVICGKGTYVRSLADDLAQALGGRAHLAALRRSTTGSLSVQDASSVAVISQAAERGQISSYVLPPAEGLKDLASVEVSEETARAVTHGMRFPAQMFPGSEPDAPFLVLDPTRRLLAVYRVRDREVVPEVVVS